MLTQVRLHLKIYNIGNNKTVKLMDIVKFYEKNFKLKAKKNYRGMRREMWKELMQI